MIKVKGNYLFRFILYGIILLLSIKYNSLYDILLITALFFASFLYGKLLLNRLKARDNYWICCAVGFGFIGVVIYFILLFGLGSKALYALILLLPFPFNFKKLSNIKQNAKNQLLTKRISLNEIGFYLILMVYLIYSSAPISPMEGDAIAKHLPITLYAAQNGAWYTNVVEDIVYSESMVMQYTYSTVFASFNAYKALTLLNTVCFFIIFFFLKDICKKIYSNANTWILGCLYFTLPLLFDLSTMFYLDILPLFFVFSAMITFVDLDKEKIWDSLSCIAFLFGCALFSKLTISYTVLTLGVVCIVVVVPYLKQVSKPMIILKKIVSSTFFFVLPFITSIIVMYYKTGNPLLPAYNGIFKSPYFSKTNFVDIFDNHPLGLNLKSLINMTFHTSLNRIDGPDGALGLYLLLIVLIPFAIIVYKNKKMIVWSVIPFVTYWIACMFTYNVRYFASVYVLLIIAIVLALSILINKCKSKISTVLIIITSIYILVPNLYVINSYYGPYLKQSLTPDNGITFNTNGNILKKEIPENKKVLSVNLSESYKGEYNGFYMTTSWRNTFLMDLLGDDTEKWMQFVSCFDYVINRTDLPIEQSVLKQLVDSADEENCVFETFAKVDNRIIYKVNKNNIESILIMEESFIDPVIVNEPSPIVRRIDNLSDFYIISEDINNTKNDSITVRFQINWMDAEDNFLDADIITYEAKSGRNVYTSMPIKARKGASYGLVFIGTDNEETVEAYGFSVSQQIDLIDSEIEKFYNRDLLK